MILSVSRRTDIPAFYGRWFINRLKDGFVCVRNPFNKNMVSKIPIGKDIVDCIVFWTKDAYPFMQYLNDIDNLEYKYYFQFTITPYGKDIESNLRNKNEIINTFIELSNKIGKEKVIWRYDPILLSNEITIDWHIDNFKKMCARLADFTYTVVISFLDEYKKLNKTKYRALCPDEMQVIGKEFVKIARKYNLKIQTCAENINIEGIEKGACIDKNLIEQICGYSLNVKKDKTQRQECLCAQSIDIGEYDTCSHFCGYCYANNSKNNIRCKMQKHNPNSLLLIGEIQKDDKIYERETKSLK